MDPFFIWLIAAAVFVIIELLSLWVWSICVGAGCLVAAIASLLGADLAWQIVCVAAGSLIFFICFGKALERTYRRHGRHTGHNDTNMDDLKGREAIVIESTTPRAPARVRIDGDNWQVITADGHPLHEGQKIRITGYDSIILSAVPVGPDTEK